MTIKAHATARAIAQLFGAGHRAGHAGTVQDALATHPTIKNGALTDFFNQDHQSFRSAFQLQPPPKGSQQPFETSVK
jgi:hypothetical protein